jgi:peptide-methionine (S)-S-oxide reductase
MKIMLSKKKQDVRALFSYKSQNRTQQRLSACMASMIRDWRASDLRMWPEAEEKTSPGFTRAEDYHQKYTLRQSRALMKEFQRMYPSSERFVDSTAAARINGYLAGHGGCEQLKAEIDDMGLSSEGTQRLLKVVCSR